MEVIKKLSKMRKKINKELVKDEEYAIKFQDWLTENCTLSCRIWTYLKDNSKIYTMEELIELFNTDLINKK